MGCSFVEPPLGGMMAFVLYQSVSILLQTLCDELECAMLGCGGRL